MREIVKRPTFTLIDRFRSSMNRTSSQTDRKLFYSAIIVLVLSFVVLGFAVHSEQRSRGNVQRSAEQQTAFHSGQAISLGSATMRISNLTYSDGSGHFIAPAGKHYLIVDLTVKNYSDAPINVLPSNDTYVKDSAGRVVYLTPYEVSQPFRAGELLPGETITGQLSYLVPKSGQLNYYIDAIWSGGVVPIKVQ